MEQLSKQSKCISWKRQPQPVKMMKGKMKTTIKEMIMKTMRLMVMTMHTLMKTILQLDAMSMPE